MIYNPKAKERIVFMLIWISLSGILCNPGTLFMDLQINDSGRQLFHFLPFLKCVWLVWEVLFDSLGQISVPYK